MLVETIHSLTVQAGVRLRALAFRRNAMKSVMQNDPVIAAKMSRNLLIGLQGFAAETVFSSMPKTPRPWSTASMHALEPEAAALSQPMSSWNLP